MLSFGENVNTRVRHLRHEIIPHLDDRTYPSMRQRLGKLPTPPSTPTAFPPPPLTPPQPLRPANQDKNKIKPINGMPITVQRQDTQRWHNVDSRRISDNRISQKPSRRASCFQAKTKFHVRQTLPQPCATCKAAHGSR